ncbi:hypothetical protein SLEP1_g8327 [Rubroshorea leprosula]|uniref:Uncharacterized protein n=1 Tax=Rubroshorea leprosula TaxID=152421 RepID=A0AAV5IAE1_9ROSI|nr:hypothetical protein SLEP1_g8327 [Rubroshorea leprosula]
MIVNLLHQPATSSVMSRTNGAVTSFLSLLILTSLFSPKLLVFGSPIRDPSSKRPDPLRHFKNYNGSFTITNDHYWASTAFTGVPEYAMAGVWVLCGVCFGIYLACNWKSFSGGSSSPTNHFDRHYFLTLALILLFTFLAIIIFLCWIITAVCWILTGADFFIESVAEDICSAFQDYVQNPQDNDLSSILPCMNSTASDKILSAIGFTVHNFITKLNLKITKVCQTLGLNEQKDEWFPFAMICDPFSAATNYSYAPQKCTDNTIHIGDLPNILAGFTCYRQNSPRSCISSGKFLSEKEFRKASAYSYSIQTMLNVFPDLMSLTRCNVVKDSFTDIALNQCRPFRQSMRLLWVSMLCLSIFMMDLLLTWVVKVYLERGRSFNRCSIFPKPRHGRQADQTLG